MPYPKAHFYIVALTLATVLGFWPGYFSILDKAPPAFHFHGITATLWMLVLAAQNWSIHNRRAAWHRHLGKLSLGLFPLFMAGFFGVFQTESQKALAGEPFRVIIGPGIGLITIIAVVTIGYLYHGALKYRKKLQLHARYMLAIPFIFSESVFGRILNNHMPGLIVRTPEDAYRIYWGFHISELMAIGLALYLHALAPRFGRPFLVVSGAMILQSAAFEWLGQGVWWREQFLAVANLPVALVVSAGLVAGALVTWRGWAASARPNTPVALSRA